MRRAKRASVFEATVKQDRCRGAMAKRLKKKREGS